MAPVRQAVPDRSFCDQALDPDSVEWLQGLKGGGTTQDAATARLYELLLRVAGSEARRRSAQLRVIGPELDDLAHQAAADATVNVLARLHTFRGESRFTSWACKFVIFEVSSKVTRHFWRHPTAAMDVGDWDRLPDRLGLAPDKVSEWRDLVAALRSAVDSVLTDHQRRIFVAIVLNGVPLDVLVEELNSNRNAVYKALFDARRKLRNSLVTSGFLSGEEGSRPT